MGRQSEIDPRREFARADLGDRRLNTRLDQLVAVLEDAPDRSFPSATRSDAELEGAYRFFKNPKVTLGRLLAPHVEETVRRARAASSVLVLHDTTEFRFGGSKPRDGLGVLTGDGQGFFGHFALAIAGDGSRAPLGLAGVLTFRRDANAPRERNEFFRWGALIGAVTTNMGDLDPVHVMDREADDFDLFSDMAGNDVRFVARMTKQRLRKARSPDVETDSPYLRDLLYAAHGTARREVRLSARAGKRGGRSERTHPVRETRFAELTISAARVEIQPPRRWSRNRQPLMLAAVLVVEATPPPGQQPVEWMLVTTEPIETKEQVLKIVDIYRARWMIEEYFKALKTGCAVERRQLESAGALEAALGLFAPLAVRLLALRHQARSAPTDPATTLFSKTELAALRTLARSPLPRRPTVLDALHAVAKLGGHLPRNGVPGWLVLSRGLEKLDVAAQVVAQLSVGKRHL